MYCAVLCNRTNVLSGFNKVFNCKKLLTKQGVCVCVCGREEPSEVLRDEMLDKNGTGQMDR